MYHSLYFVQVRANVVMVLVYIDVLFILLSNIEAIVALKSKLEVEYKMMDLGELHYCLSVEFVRD